MTDPIFGKCAKHPGENFVRCSSCEIERMTDTGYSLAEVKRAEMRDKPPRTCNLIGCFVKLTRQQEDEAYCSDECRAEAMGTYEAVDHPKHYNVHPGGIECIDVIEHMTFNIGSAVKYLWRAGCKPGTESDEDFKKALWYIERERTINERIKR